MKSNNRPLIIHPFILAIYPLIFLYVVNIGDVSFRNIVNAAILVLLISGVLFAVLGWLTKRWEQSGLTVSVSLLLFFYYGHIHEYLFIQHGIPIGRHRYMLPIWGLTFCLMQYFVWMSGYRFLLLTQFLNVISVVLLIGVGISLMTHAYYYSKAGSFLPQNEVVNLQGQLTGTPAKESYPDIYYIILDGYARQDTLAELYEYLDNDLVEYLDAKGFYVARKSAANYAHTFLSLASSLNMTHLLHLSENPGVGSAVKKIPYQMIENNEVVRFLKKQGYAYVHYSSGYEPTQSNRLADVSVNCYPEDSNQVLALVLQTTLLSAIEPRFPHHWFYRNRKEAEKKLCMFSSIDDATNTRSPKFVFMHILLPHPPFLFRQDGTYSEDRFSLTIDYWGNRKKYREQLIFLNQKVKAMIEQILSRSERPPIIIVQGDHGPASTINFDNPSDQGIKERMQILNAYLLPDGGAKGLYESITPVNSFRLVFNQYLGTNLKPEEDKSYLSAWSHPYKFEDVTSVLRNKLNADGPQARQFHAVETQSLIK